MNDAFRKTYNFFIKEGFLPLAYSDYRLLRYYNRGSMLQERSALLSLIWYNNPGYGNAVLYKIINGSICSLFFFRDKEMYWVVRRPEEKPAYPLQPVIDELFELCKNAGFPSLRIKFIDEHILPEYQAVCGYSIETDFSFDNSEYAYNVKDLMNLKGSNNYYKRKRLKKFQNMENISIIPMTNNNARTCLDIEEAWCNSHDCFFCGSFLGCEKLALEALVDIFDDTHQTGLLMYVDETPAGYIICEKISQKLSFLYFGKSTITDGFVYLIYVMYRDYLNDVEYMNISEDMGHDGLRRFKKLLSPYEMWHKYTVTYNSMEGLQNE